MLRTVIAVLAGLLAALLLIMGAEKFAHWLSPLPGNLKLEDKLALANAMYKAPVTLYLALLAGYAVAAFAGGLAAALLSERNPTRNAVVVGCLLTIAGIANLASLPHVPWFWGSLLVYIPLAWLGARLVTARHMPPGMD